MIVGPAAISQRHADHIKQLDQHKAPAKPHHRARAHLIARLAARINPQKSFVCDKSFAQQDGPLQLTYFRYSSVNNCANCLKIRQIRSVKARHPRQLQFTDALKARRAKPRASP